MAKTEATKSLIADALKRLAENTPFDKIRVQDIVDASGINRKTFYYHFKDKQDLVCWIFDAEFSEITDTDKNNTTLDELFEMLYANRNFYTAALSSDIQNNLSEHLYKVIYHGMITKILDVLDVRTMPAADIAAVAGYFSNAITGSITQWARGGMRSSPVDISDCIYPITEECLGFFINKHYKG